MVTKASKNNQKIDLVESTLEESNEEMRKGSIFFIMGAKPEQVVITGAALRTQTYKKGDANVIDLKIVTEDERVQIATIPQFAKFAYNDTARLLKKHGVKITARYPAGIKADLKMYKWVATPAIPIIITPNEFNDRIWIGRIKEIPIPVEAPLGANLLDEIEDEVSTQEISA
jgi:hypothetical protein